MAGSDLALVLQLSADINGLNKQLAKAGQVLDQQSGQMERRAKKAAENIEKPFLGMKVGEALEKTFSSARLGVLEEGGAKIGVFGSALEALGPAGVAAGAGLAAVGLGLEQAKQAAEYAEGLQKAADKLGITTDRLQEYDLIAAEAGVSTETFRAGLLTAQEAFGALMTGIGDGRVKKAFDEIGITPDQAKSFGSLEAALPAISDGIEKLGNTAAQAKVAKALGLEDLLPALRQGSGALADTADEAHKLGIVMDSELVARGAEAAEQLKVASAVINTQLKEAFISLAPVIVAVMGKVAALATALNDVFGLFKSVDQRATSTLEHEQANLQKQGDPMQSVARFTGARVGADGQLHGGVGFFTDMSNRYTKSRRDMSETLADRSWDSFNTDYDNDAAQKKAAQLLKNQDKGPRAKKGPTDDTDARTSAALEAVDAANKDLATALAALTGDIDDHAQFERDAIADDAAKTNQKLIAQQAAIDADKGLSAATKKALTARLDQARTTETQAEIAKLNKLDRDTPIASKTHDDQIAAQLSASKQQELEAQAQITAGAYARAQLEIAAFRAAQAQALIAREDENRQKVANGEPQEAADADLAGFKAMQAAQLAAKRDAELRQANPLYGQAHPLDSISDDLRGVESKGLDSLSSGIEGVVTGTKTLKAAFHDMAQGIIADLVQIAVKRAIEQPLANLLLGAPGLNTPTPSVSVDPISFDSGASLLTAGASDAFKALFLADGGPVTGPGGPRSDSIPAMLSAGEYVMPAEQARRFGPILEQMRRGGRHYADGGSVYPTPENGPEASAPIATGAQMAVPG